jgi:hypothetical protein
LKNDFGVVDISFDGMNMRRSNGNSRFPSGMTSKSNSKGNSNSNSNSNSNGNGNSNSNGNSRFPSGMTKKKARARATADSLRE